MTRRAIQTRLGVAIGIYLLAYLLPLGARPFAAPDESRYLEIPREMRASGDWVVPRINGVRYFEKTPLGYWLSATAMSVFGQTTYAGRLPSALAAGLAALIVGLLVARFGDGPAAGVLAAIALLTCLEVFIVGTANILDGPFTLFVTASMAAFFTAAQTPHARARRRWLALFGIACGLGFLTKGFLAFALPVLAIVPWMVWQRRFLELFRMCWIPLAAALLVIGPWAVAIAVKEPDFWRYFIVVEHLQRFASSGGHHGPFWYYMPIVLAGFLPWTALLPIGVRGFFRSDRTDPLSRFAICWFAFPLAFFTISASKVETYILPCFAPLIVFTVTGLVAALRTGRQREYNIAAMILGAMLVIDVLVFIVAIRIDPEGVARRTTLVFPPGESWRWIAMAAGLSAWAVVLFASAVTRHLQVKPTLFAAGPVAAMVALAFAAPTTLERKLPGPYLASRLAERVTPQTILASDDNFVHTVCWLFERDDVVMVHDRGELDYGLSYEDAADRFMTHAQFDALLRDPRRDRPVVYVGRWSGVERIWPTLPAPAWEDRRSDIVLALFE